MKLYKLTDQNGNTQNNTHWDVGVIHELKPCDNPQLCSGDVIHAYKNVNLAYLLNSIHANIDKPLLWECNGNICTDDFGKVGCFRLKITKRLSQPVWVGNDNENLVRVAFAVLCAESVLYVWNKYNKKDKRIEQAIDAAKEYLNNPTKDTTYAAARAARAATIYAADYAATYAARAAPNINFCELADIAVKTIMEN